MAVGTYNAGNMEEKAKKEIEGIFNSLDGIKIDDIKAEGVTIYAGTKVLKLEVIKEEDAPDIEAKVREEFRVKLREKLSAIKEKVATKINEMSSFVSQIRIEYERKEQKLKEEKNRVQAMPDVTFDHAKAGLSVVNNTNKKNGLIWIVQGTYNPKYIDRKPIDPMMVSRLMSHIVIMIETAGTNVTNVSTRKPFGLDYFPHYHQHSPDCWGDWKHPPKWKTPDDILYIAHQAEGVLENINSNSIGQEDPYGFPRFSELKKYILRSKKKKENLEYKKPNSEMRRRGIEQTDASPNEDSWDDVWSAQ